MILQYLVLGMSAEEDKINRGKEGGEGEQERERERSKSWKKEGRRNEGWRETYLTHG